MIKIKIYKILNILFVIAMLCLLFSQQNLLSINSFISIALVSAIIFFVTFFYRFILDEEIILKTLNKKIFLFLFALFSVLVFVINSFDIINFINYIVLISSLLLNYIVLNKLEDKKISILFFFFISLLIPIFLNLNNYSNYIYFSALYTLIVWLYSLRIEEEPGRRRNTLLCIAIGMISIIGILFDKMFIYVFIAIIIDNFFSNKIRYSLKYLLLLFITCVCYFCFSDIVNYSFESSNMLYTIFMKDFIAITMLIGSCIELHHEYDDFKYTYLKIPILLSILGGTKVLLLFNPVIVLITFSYILRKKKTNIYNEYAHKVKSDNYKKISVVIPNYNYEKYIIERIDSVLLQNYPIYELIVLDDCSSDNSVKIIKEKIKEIKEKNPDLIVKFVPNTKNSGNVFKQWRKAFKISTGDYLWIAEADDSCSNMFLKNVMKGFDDKKVVISYCESLTMDENNNVLMQNLRPWIDLNNSGKWDISYYNNGKNEIKENLCINNTIANVSSVVFKKDSKINFDKYLKEAEWFKLAGDWYFYVKVLENGNIYYDKKSLNYHRMHGNSVTLTTKKEREYNEIITIQEYIKKHHKLNKKTLEKIDNRRASLRARFGISDEEFKLQNKKIKKSNKILLSIIIPVYNTEKYIKRCLDSIFNNITDNTEVIIINDGSTDNSEKIIKEYTKLYPEIIKYYNKKNGGLSDTRNFGLKKANGEYIAFVDSDDWVSPNMFSSLLKKAILEDLDIVYSDIEIIFENGTNQYVSLTNYERDDEFLKIIDTSLMPTSCNKVIRKNLFLNLSYPINLNNEDIAVTPILLARCPKIGKINSHFYKYFQRTGSIQNSGFSSKRFAIFETSKLCFERAKEFDKNRQDMIKGSIYNHQLLALLIYLISNIEEKKKRIEYINDFCIRINELGDYSENEYVLEWLNNLGYKKLIQYLKNSDSKKIDSYLRLKKLLNNIKVYF